MPFPQLTILWKMLGQNYFAEPNGMFWHLFIQFHFAGSHIKHRWNCSYTTPTPDQELINEPLGAPRAQLVGGGGWWMWPSNIIGSWMLHACVVISLFCDGLACSLFYHIFGYQTVFWYLKSGPFVCSCCCQTCLQTYSWRLVPPI